MGLKEDMRKRGIEWRYPTLGIKKKLVNSFTKKRKEKEKDKKDE